MTLRSVNALRHYHEVGLLPPAGLDLHCDFPARSWPLLSCRCRRIGSRTEIFELTPAPSEHQCADRGLHGRDRGTG